MVSSCVPEQPVHSKFYVSFFSHHYARDIGSGVFMMVPYFLSAFFLVLRHQNDKL